MKFVFLKNRRGWLTASGAIFIAVALGTAGVQAHGYVGDRFFPPTIQTDDPFAVDELAFPTVSTFLNPGNPATLETDVGFEFSKEIFHGLALGAAENWVHLQQDGAPTV